MFVDAIVCAIAIEADVVSCIGIVQLYLKANANARTSQAPAACLKYQILGEPPGSRTQIEREPSLRPLRRLDLPPLGLLGI